MQDSTTPSIIDTVLIVAILPGMVKNSLHYSLTSSFYIFCEPLNKFIDMVKRKADESNYQVTVVIPQFIPKKGWHNLLHNQSSFMIRTHLLHHKDIVITTVPYHLKR